MRSLGLSSLEEGFFAIEIGFVMQVINLVDMKLAKISLTTNLVEEC